MAGTALTLAPDGDGTRSVVVNETGGTTNLYQSVDDSPDTPTTSDWLTAGENDGYMFLDVTATPSDFGAIEVLLTARAYLSSSGYGADICTIYAQIFKSDETTELTDEVAVGTETSSGLVTADLTVNATGLAASKADWDAARVRVRWDYSPVITLSAPEDGTDVTDLLNSQIAAAPSGATLVGSGNWRVDGTLTINQKNSLTILGPFTIYRPGAATTLGSPQFDIHTSENIVVRNIRVEGPGQIGGDGFAVYDGARESEHAFAVRTGSKNVLIEDCTFSKPYGDGIYVGYHNDGVPNENVTVRRVTGDYPGRQQVAVTHLHGGLFEDITVDYGARSGLDVEPNHTLESVRDVTFRRLHMGSRWYPYVVGGRLSGDLGAATEYRRNITLEDCEGYRATTAHPAVQASRGGQGLIVTDHTDLRNSQYYGVAANGWTDVDVEGCVCGIARQTPTTYGVGLYNAKGTLIIRNNDFTGAGGYDHGADELYVADTSVAHCGNSWGSTAQAGIQTDGSC